MQLSQSLGAPAQSGAEPQPGALCAARAQPHPGLGAHRLPSPRCSGGPPAAAQVTPPLPAPSRYQAGAAASAPCPHPSPAEGPAPPSVPPTSPAFAPGAQSAPAPPASRPSRPARHQPPAASPAAVQQPARLQVGCGGARSFCFIRCRHSVTRLYLKSFRVAQTHAVTVSRHHLHLVSEQKFGPNFSVVHLLCLYWPQYVS